MRTGGCHSSVAEHKSAIGVQASTPGVSQPFLFPLFSLHNIQNSLLYVTHHLCTCQNISMRIQQEIHQVISCCQHCMADLYGLIDSLNQRACKSAALTAFCRLCCLKTPLDTTAFQFLPCSDNSLPLGESSGRILWENLVGESCGRILWLDRRY